MYCLEELSSLKKQVFFKNVLKKIRLRFKHGIKEDLIVFINLKGIGRVRARKLIAAGFKNLNDLIESDFESLAKILGESLTIKIKQELKNSIVDYNEDDKPKEIKIREVSDEEIDLLVENDMLFEKEKKESQMKLTNFF